MLNWIVWNRTSFIKMDLALNNPQRLICHETQTTEPNQSKPGVWELKKSTCDETASPSLTGCDSSLMSLKGARYLHK